MASSLCIHLQIQFLIVEINANFIVNLLNNDNREANGCSDNIAKSGTNMFSGFCCFWFPPDCILDQFRLDALGTVFFFFFLYSQCHNSVAPLFYSIPVSQKIKKKWTLQKIPLLLDYLLNNNHIQQQYGLPHYLTRISYTSYVLSPSNCELVGFTPINGVNRPMGYQLIV